MAKGLMGAILLSLGLLVACAEHEEDDRYEAAQRAVTEMVSEETSDVPESKVDWTPVFQSWENGCEDSLIFSQLESNLIHFAMGSVGSDGATEDDKPQLGQVVLPMRYQNAVGEVRLEDKGEYSNIVVPLQNSEYYGIPVDAIVFYRGHGTGVSGSMLVFKEPLAVVQNLLKKVQYKESIEPLEATGETVQAAVDVYTKDQAALMCDWSN